MSIQKANPGNSFAENPPAISGTATEVNEFFQIDAQAIQHIYVDRNNLGDGRTLIYNAGTNSLVFADPAGVVDASLVHTTGTETVAGAKTFTGTTRLDSYYGAITIDTDGATISMDCNVSVKHMVVLGGNRTLALVNSQVGQSILVILQQDGTGNRTVTWPAGTIWAGGSAPLLTSTANKIDMFTLFKLNGTPTFVGLIVAQNI